MNDVLRIARLKICIWIGLDSCKYPNFAMLSIVLTHMITDKLDCNNKTLSQND